MMYKAGVLIIGSLLLCMHAISQSPPPPLYKVSGYVGIVHPIVTLSGGNSSFNFNGSYTVGFPVGINLWKTKRIGLSVEFVPTIKADNKTSKMTNFLFHPGILIGFDKGWTFAGRIAFETGGRYGFTPVINKIVKKNKLCSYFVAAPFPFRFGNDQPFSFTAGIEFGIIF